MTKNAYGFIIKITEIFLTSSNPDEVITELFNDKSLFLKILADGYVHIAQSLLEQSKDPKILDKVLVTDQDRASNAIEHVAMAGDIKLLTWLLDKKFLCTSRALINACQRGNFEAVKLILPHIPKLDAGTVLGRTHIEIAADLGQWDIVKIISERLERDGVSVQSRTLLMALEENVSSALIVLLIKTNTNSVHLQTEHNSFFTVLHWAIQHNLPQILKLLLDNFSVCLGWFDKDKKRPIELAAELRRWDLVRIIASHKRTDAEDEFNYANVLKLAVLCNQLDIVKVLIDAGTATRYQDGNSLLHIAARCNKPECPEIVQYLLDIGLDPEEVTFQGETPLQLARNHANTAARTVVKILESHKIKDEIRFSSRMRDAVMQNNEGLMRDLLNQGAILRWVTPENHYTALHWLVYYADKHRDAPGNYYILVNVLLENGADPLKINKEGESPLTMAASRGQWLLVKVMLEYQLSKAKIPVGISGGVAASKL